MLPITTFFAGILALIYLALSVNIIRSRYKMRLALGDGGDAMMTRRIRAHANFSEYVPLALLLLGFNELNNLDEHLLFWLATALTVGRVSHIYSLLVMEVKHPGRIIFRQVGMVTTLTVIAVLALAAIL